MTNLLSVGLIFLKLQLSVTLYQIYFLKLSKGKGFLFWDLINTNVID